MSALPTLAINWNVKIGMVRIVYVVIVKKLNKSEKKKLLLEVVVNGCIVVS